MATTSSRRNSFDLDIKAPARGGVSKVRRFNGLTRRSSDWDGLRRDSQLWFNGADCAVHFSAYRASQRGPSLKIPFDVVQELRCEYLSNHCLRTHNKLSPIASEDGHSDSGYGSEQERTEYELYIPAPADLTKDQAFEYHLNTRNLIAYAVGKPLVGEKLSNGLSGLWHRMREWQVGDGSIEALKKYCREQGYLSLAENAEHALAFLKFAEDARLPEIWIDAFVHCVGMHHRLDLSPEWAGLSKTSMALITRASLEMDLHIARIVRALGGFLEEELSAEHLGLSRQARIHLDRFRSFLHAFYVDKLGYFPPRQGKSWNKRVWARVHRDFQCLHDYLVDRESTSDLNGNKGVTGGVCLVQNLTAFDEKHGYTPLPHSLPLLPDTPSKPKRGVSSQRGLRTLSLSMSNSTPEFKTPLKQALEKATNKEDNGVTSCTLVQEYQRFERQRLEEKLDVAEARKTRWILIYTVLQMLNSIMSAPKEVTDTKTASYPLCSLISGCPPWKDAPPSVQSSVEHDSPVAEKQSSFVPDAMYALEGRTSRISIHPDCEAENAEQFFASTGGLSRQGSQAEMNMTPSPLRVNTNLSRRNSLRGSMYSSVNMLHKSVLDSISRRGSSRRGSLQTEPKTEPKKMPSFCEIVVEEYGNGLVLDDGVTNEPASIEPEPSSAVPTEQSATNDFALFDFGLAMPNDEPTLEDPELAESTHSGQFHVDYPDLVDTSSPRDSGTSEDFGLYRISSHGSYGDPGTPLTNASSYEELDSAADCKPSSYHPKPLVATPSMQLKLHSYIPSKLAPAHHSGTSVNAGCYRPTGMVAPPTSRFAPKPSPSASEASSLYGDEATQADDIEEEEMRGRRRSRAMDTFARVGAAARNGFIGSL